MPRANAKKRIKEMTVGPIGDPAETKTSDLKTDTLPEAPPVPRVSADALKNLGQQLGLMFDNYRRDRRAAEIQWTKSLRQFLGVYDPEVRALLKGRSEAYPKLTRVKCISMLSRLMNLLFPSSEKNWTIEASPVPNLSPEDLQLVLDKMTSEQAPMTDESITAAVREFARDRARNLELEIADQLTEAGGTAQLSYVALCRKVLMSGIMYGMGVLKGPFARKQVQTRWKLGDPDPDTGQQKITPEQVETLVPQFDFVPLWDYYPDFAAKYLHQMDGQFQRIVMSREQVRALMEDANFFRPVIKMWLKNNVQGNYREQQYEAELRQLGLTEPAARPDQSRKYEVIVWDGMLSGKYLHDCGITIPEDKRHEMFECSVWMLGDSVIRANLNPWAMLEGPGRVKMYHHFMFEEDDSTLVGNGLPQIMRDSQLGVASATRMVFDNASIVCGPSVEVVRALLKKDKDYDSIHAFQVWDRDEEESSATVNQPAVRSVSYDAHIDELTKIITLCSDFADKETFVSAATGGDMQKGPSEPFRTAAGASMLQGLMALPFKDVVRNFDVFTESVLGSTIVFNKHFNKKNSISGDFQAVARGSTSLVAKEVRGIAIDELARSLTPGEQLYVNSYGLLRERCLSRDIPLENVIVDEDEAKRRDAAQAERTQAQEASMAHVMEATVRKMLADAVKSLTQADKNASAAEVAMYNALAKELTNGITPTTVAKARATGEVPSGVVKEQRNAGGAGNGRAVAKRPAKSNA